MSTPNDLQIYGVWTPQLTDPIYDGNNPHNFRVNDLIYSDIDYPAIPSSEIAVSLQRYVSAAGSDSNDGQLVANGGTGAWATPGYALDQLCASSTWRWLNLQGAITHSTFHDLKYSGAGPGIAGTPAVIRSDPNNPATLTMDARLEIDGQTNWLWHSFSVDGSYGVSLGQDLPTEYHTFRNIIGTMGDSLEDNHGMIQALNSNVDYFGVFNSPITGPPVAFNGNSACIIAFGIHHLRIENSNLTGAPRSLYYKHANTGVEEPPGWFIRNNYIDTTTLSVQVSGRFGEVSNNIFAKDLDISNTGGGEAPFDQLLNHNTIMGNLTIYDGDGDTVINDIVSTNNIVVGKYIIDQYGTSAYTNTSTSNYNLMGSDVIFQGTAYATVSAWNAASVPANQDANSIDGLPTFVGGATPSTIAGYALDIGSNGENAASDGEDMGADVSIVGVL